VQGIVTKKNPKTLQVTTSDNYYVNIPATYVTLVKTPSQKLLDFRKKIAPTHEEMHQMLEMEIKEGTLH
jgi:ribosomal protein S3AE